LRLLIAAGVPALTMSNAVVYLAVLAGVLARAPEYFFSPDEAAALDWLAAQARGAVVLAGPDLSLFLPVRTDARVVYGHDFETVDAARQKRAALAFFAGDAAPQPFLDERRIDLVVAGPREAALGGPPELPGWRVAFRQGEVRVYAR
jgi:hypothetical protein